MITHLALQSQDTSRLFAMLTTCRPHGSQAEHDFIKRFLLPLGVEADGFGNLWLQLGAAPILWSSHVDTCHRKAGAQRIAIDEAGFVMLALDEAANCLGADCTAGVWLMTEMITAGIEGRYVFHRGEERGGLGSRHVATAEPERLHGIRAAIAFDRRGTSSVITHQSGERCCSDLFADALAAAIGLGHRPDPTGTFTDTANYIDLVGECTNLSVGYQLEHTANETLDLAYLIRLRAALLQADLTALTYERRPGEREADDWDKVSFHRSWRGTARLADLVRNYPDDVVDFLEMNGVSADELAEFIDSDIPF